MKIVSVIKGLGLACCVTLSACATAGQGNVEPKTSYQVTDRKALSPEFISLENGSKYQARTGLLCPPIIAGMTLEDTYTYRADGTDVSCSFLGENQELTIYLYPMDDYEFNFIFDDAMRAILQSKQSQGFRHDPQASQICTLQGLLLAAVISEDATSGGGIGVSASGDKEGTPYTYETGILTSDELFTALALHEVDGQFLKLRYTERMLDTADETRRGEICNMLADVTRERHNDVLNPPKL